MSVVPCEIATTRTAMASRVTRAAGPLALAAALAACGGGNKPETAGPQRVAGTSGGDVIIIPPTDPSLCAPDDKKQQTFDLDQDGQPDLWKLVADRDKGGTRVEVQTCKQADLNFDGRKDYVVSYDDSGALLTEDFDFDFDGKFDARYHYDRKTKRRYLIERVSGFHEKPDIWEKLDGDERPESVRRDRNGDQKPDYWEQYRAGVLEKILYDDDYDGKVDRKDERGASSGSDPGASVAPAAGDAPGAPTPAGGAKPTPAAPATSPPSSTPAPSGARPPKGR